MENTKSAKGSCLCGKINVEIATMKKNIGVCHCNMCRKWSAGPFLTVDCGTDVKFTGEEHLGVYESSNWAERGFCKNCGTNLFYKLKEKQHYMFSSEILGEKDLKFDHEVFIDEKPTYYDFANESKKMTGEECFAAFSSQG